MRIVGIDCGLHGALALYDTDEPDRVIVEDMPVVNKRVNGAQVAALLRRWEPDAVFVETVDSQPRDGHRQAHSFGRSIGKVEGVVEALAIPKHERSPAAWRKRWRLDGDKERCRALAINLFPADAALFARVKDHNRAEAALIARDGAESLSRRDAA